MNNTIVKILDILKYIIAVDDGISEGNFKIIEGMIYEVEEMIDNEESNKENMYQHGNGYFTTVE